MSDLSNYLLDIVKELALYECKAGRAALTVSVRRDAIANRVLTRARSPFRPAEMRALMLAYRGGCFGPYLKDCPDGGSRCGLWSQGLKAELTDVYLDVRAMFLVSCPLTPAPAMGISEWLANYENEEARKRVADRGLGSFESLS